MRNTKGIDLLKELVGKIKYEDVVDIRISPTQSRAVLKDGTTYTVVMANISSRGHNCDMTYVDSNVPQELLDNVIKPCLYYSNLKEEEKIIFF